MLYITQANNVGFYKIKKRRYFDDFYKWSNFISRLRNIAHYKYLK